MRRTYGDDDTLLRASLRGDDFAFAELVRRHRPWVVRLLTAFVREGDAAEDLAQEVFTRLHRHAHGYKEQGAFVPYLKRIALNVGRTHLKRAAGVAFVCLEDIDDAPGGSLLDDVLTRAVHAQVRSAAETLPDDQREALALRYFVGLTVPEIAARLGCPEGTVKSRLHHAVRKIRTALEPSEETLP